MKITDSIYQVDEVMGGPTVIVSGDEVTLVDTGLPGNDEKILAFIESLGHKRGALKHILLTHSDGDHIGSLPALAAASGARVYAQRAEADVIEGKRKSRGGQVVSTPVTVDQIVKEGDVLPIHGGIRVVESFGHTTGHVSYHVLAEDVLIAGDCLRNVDGLTGSAPQYTANMDQAKQTVGKLAGLGADSLCFGHGPAIVGGAREQLRSLAASQ
jgi:glyoxylase-like metal-dependent hydrolase (beta-lactamase superfamily II)